MVETYVLGTAGTVEVSTEVDPLRVLVTTTVEGFSTLLVTVVTQVVGAAGTVEVSTWVDPLRVLVTTTVDGFSAGSVDVTTEVTGVWTVLVITVE